MNEKKMRLNAVFPATASPYAKFFSKADMEILENTQCAGTQFLVKLLKEKLGEPL